MTTTIDAAAAVLRAGGLVAFPTETVYGLGADAANADAVRRIFAAKGRPVDHPLIVHLASVDQIATWAREIPAAAATLAHRFWPGPMTLILPRAAGVLDEVTGGQDSVGLRIPSHPMAQALLRAFGGGIAGPSANRFGRISPTTAAHVREEMGDRVDVILDGGACDVGIESTIVDLTSAQPTLLRPGHISVTQLEEALVREIRRPTSASPRVSGSLAAHYAPSKPMQLIGAGRVTQAIAELREAGVRGVIAVYAFDAPGTMSGVLWRSAPPDNAAYAHDLYAVLREFDHSPCERILVESPPQGPQWQGVLDRLGRAAFGSGAASMDSP